MTDDSSLRESFERFALKSIDDIRADQKAAEDVRRAQYPDFFRLAEPLRSGFTDFARDWTSEEVDGDYDIDLHLEGPLWDSNSITSEVMVEEEPIAHRVAIDLDLDAALVPSTTPGHHHLLIDLDLSWEKYERLLHALMEAGVIQEGYYNASVERQHTRLRTPWTQKQPEDHGVASFDDVEPVSEDDDQ